jgi:hypothetical protein
MRAKKERERRLREDRTDRQNPDYQAEDNSGMKERTQTMEIGVAMPQVPKKLVPMG